VLAVIQSDSASFEMVSRGCGLAADQLNMALVDLELLGFIVAVGGQYSLKI
jgi:predicted Rossmann fold nucleotide-binding protein DprA/Smf involved in DNA uptake